MDNQKDLPASIDVPRTQSNPEARVQRAIITFLQQRGWLVAATHGNAYQSGFPDLFCYHPVHGMRWVDVKYHDSFTKAQCQTWPEWEKYGLGVWIMFGVDDYDKLFQPPNFRDHWKPRYDKYVRDVNEILGELDDE